MRTITIRLFTLGELSGHAREQAFESVRNRVFTDGWWDGVYQDMTEELEAEGFRAPEIFFRGFSSQGDGACFRTLDPIDVERFLHACQLENEFRSMLHAIRNDLWMPDFKIFLHGRYSHEETMYLEGDGPTGHGWFYFSSSDDGALERERQLRDQIPALQARILGRAKAKAREIYRRLEKEHDRVGEESNLIAFADEERMEFTSAGRVHS